MEKIFESFTEYLQSVNEAIFSNNDELKQFADDLKNKLKDVAPTVEVTYGEYLHDGQKGSCILRIILEPKEQYPNGIWQNANYSMFSIDSDGTIEQAYKNYKIKTKFRKTKAKSLDDAVSKITKYIETIKKELGK